MVVYKHLPSQVAVHFTNRSPTNSIENAPTPKVMRTRLENFLRLRHFIVSMSFDGKSGDRHLVNWPCCWQWSAWANERHKWMRMLYVCIGHFCTNVEILVHYELFLQTELTSLSFEWCAFDKSYRPPGIKLVLNEQSYQLLKQKLNLCFSHPLQYRKKGELEGYSLAMQ